MSTAPQIFEFEGFRVDAGRRSLTRGGGGGAAAGPVSLTAKGFDTLLLLIRRRGEVLAKTEMLHLIWPDTVVEENNLNQTISALRRALGETRGENRYIATIPGRGYCFTAEVRLGGREGSPRPADEGQIGIAVLPFSNLGAGAERDYLADGLTEETIATLGQIDPGRFSVIGRTTVMRYRNTAKSLAEIGAELGAAYLIEGSVRAEGQHLRITAKLIRVAGERGIWSASFDSRPSSLLALQRELAAAIAEQVRLHLSPGRLLAIESRHTRNPEAYDLYLRGRYFWNQFTPATTRKAIEFYTRATALDPDYALAWSGITDALCSSPVTGDVSAKELLPRAEAAAMNAIRSGPELAESQTSLGFFCFWLGWHWSRAEAAYRKALTLDASYAFAQRMLGIVLMHLRRHEEAAASIRRARELDPLSAMHRALSSQVAFAARDLPAAVQFAREAIVLDPEFWIGHFQLAQAQIEAGEQEAALETLNESARLSGGNSKALSVRGYLLARLDRRREAAEVLATLDEVARTRFVPPYARALIYAGLRETELAFRWLDRAFDAHDVHLAFLTIDPKWDPLRSDPRFADLLRRCHFPG